MLMNIMTPETVSIGYILSQTVYAPSIVLHELSCATWQKLRKCWIIRATWVQGHSRSYCIWHQLNEHIRLVIGTSVIFRIARYERRRKGRKSTFEYTPVSFNATTKGDPLRICWWAVYRPKL